MQEHLNNEIYLSKTEHPCMNTYDIFFSLDIARMGVFRKKMIYHGYF